MNLHSYAVRKKTPRGMGWFPDRPDIRDRSPEQAVAALKTTSAIKLVKDIPKMSDLREWCSPIEDQGNIGSCTAHAGVGLYEYFERRTRKKHIDASRLFLYKTTRLLAGFEGDSGAFLRNTMGALTLFGVPPEKYWPYDENNFDNDPPAFCYAFAQNFQALSYYRLDPAYQSASETIERIKRYSASGFPSMFGFTVYESIWDVGSEGKIPFPKTSENVDGGHAIMVVGYDDAMPCLNASPGAFLIRNSWGTSWGADGYGWLPYAYIIRGLADDFWSMIKGEWTDSDLFSE